MILRISDVTSWFCRSFVANDVVNTEGGGYGPELLGAA